MGLGSHQFYDKLNKSSDKRLGEVFSSDFEKIPKKIALRSPLRSLIFGTRLGVAMFTTPNQRLVLGSVIAAAIIVPTGIAIANKVKSKIIGSCEFKGSADETAHACIEFSASNISLDDIKKVCSDATSTIKGIWQDNLGCKTENAGVCQIDPENSAVTGIKIISYGDEDASLCKELQNLFGKNSTQ